ncbi:UNVERIFIED_CONTAM: hypothetical protein HDU68_011440 [Siphonaria sp. JEL0065]|nr:hypothetical protein HDU68_011440 [Siphonaria sp. JEL0065]
MRRFASVASSSASTAATVTPQAFFSLGKIQKDTVFRVVGESSPLLHVALKPTSRFVAAAGSVAAVSEGVESRLTTYSSLSETATRFATAPFNPQLFFSEFWTARSAGSVFLGPPRGSTGEISVLRLGEPDGREVIVKRNAFVAVAGENVVVKAELNADGLSAYRVFNSGSLAICAPAGSLHTISLAVNEEMLVDPELLVAWDAGIQVKQTAASTDANSASSAVVADPAPRYVGGSVGDQVAAEWQDRFNKIGRLILDGATYLGRLILWKGRNASVWGKGLYRLKGPGDFYLASRRQPTLSWLKHIPPAVFRVPKNGPK